MLLFLSLSEIAAQSYSRTLAQKRFETANHLGNVAATSADRKVAIQNGSADLVATYEADVVSYSDYYPYGMLMERRNDSEGYRYGFQGQEQDDEVKGEGNAVNYTYRMHDTRVGRFFTVDPLSSQYPYNSSYAFSENRVIDAIELEGLEKYLIRPQYLKTKRSGSRLRKITYRFIHRKDRISKEENTFVIEKDREHYFPNSKIERIPFSYYEEHNKIKKREENSELFDEVEDIYNTVPKDINGNYREKKELGSLNIGFKQDLFFSEDKGKNINEVRTVFEGKSEDYKDNFDFQVAILVNESNSMMKITGFATSKATNIEGQMLNTSKQNNSILATKRAEALRDFVIDYAKSNYNVVLEENRFNIISHVEKYEKGSPSQNASNRRVHFETE